MRRSFKVGLCPKEFPKVILLTGPKFHFNAPNGTGVTKKLSAGVSEHRGT